MSLEAAYYCTFREKVSAEGFCDLRANYTYQVLLQLLQKEPGYANFYKVRSFSSIAADLAPGGRSHILH